MEEIKNLVDSSVIGWFICFIKEADPVDTGISCSLLVSSGMLGVVQKWVQKRHNEIKTSYFNGSVSA